jgi:hypothetical protein
MTGLGYLMMLYIIPTVGISLMNKTYDILRWMCCTSEEEKARKRTPEQILRDEAKSYNKLFETYPEYEWQWGKYFSSEVAELAKSIRSHA